MATEWVDLYIIANYMVITHTPHFLSDGVDVTGGQVRVGVVEVDLTNGKPVGNSNQVVILYPLRYPHGTGRVRHARLDTQV